MDFGWSALLGDKLCTRHPAGEYLPPTICNEDKAAKDSRSSNDVANKAEPTLLKRPCQKAERDPEAGNAKTNESRKEQAVCGIWQKLFKRAFHDAQL